jgi:hypothetical protein
MNKVTQEAKSRQAVAAYASKKGKSFAAQKYGVSLSSVKRLCKRYDGTWQSLRERTRRPGSHPKQHTVREEASIRAAFSKKNIFDMAGTAYMTNSCETTDTGGVSTGCTEPQRAWGRAGEKRKPPGKHDRRYPELTTPGEKVQADVKEVPYNCLKGEAKRNGKHMYQWAAIDERTRLRYVFGYWEHAPENPADFPGRLQAAFPFPIQAAQTDNRTEFTYRFISEGKPCPFETALEKAGIAHKLIAPGTPWHNGKVERSHRNDQRYFYDWEKFSDVDELNRKLAAHLIWSNSKAMRTPGRKNPLDRLAAIQGVA